MKNIKRNKETHPWVKRRSIWKDYASWHLLLLCIPALIAYILFNYVPMVLAVSIPFRDYKFSQGILGSEWVGLKNFSWIFGNAGVGRALKNTFFYGALFMVLEPLVNATIALLLFEITSTKKLKIYQTIITLPNFMSMVVVGYITYALLSPRGGFLNSVLAVFDIAATDVYVKPELWPLILTLVHIWKTVGMGSMMYYASLVGNDPSLYEAAEIDGANRFQKMYHISIPHLIPLVCVFTIMGAGKLISGEFDLYYIIPRNSAALYSTTDTISTYVYRALQSGSYAMGATVGLVQSVVSVVLVLGANAIVKRISPDNAMF